MPANYVLLEKIVVGAAGASSVTFSGIPQTGYTDLVVKVSARSSTNSTYDDIQAKFNGVSLSYTNKHITGPGNGLTVSAGSNIYTTSAYIGSIPALTATSSTFGNAEIYIPNYTSANFKPFSCDVADERNVSTGVFSILNANLWSNTAAITSIQLIAGGGNFVQYSTFTLYGVAKLGTTPAISPYATGGDTIMTDGTYWYHTFVSSGTFTPAKALTCDYLVIAGGGGGGAAPGYNSGYPGGGGAGGLRSTIGATGGGGSLESAFSATNGTAYTITVGAGGASITNTRGGNNGNNSSIAGSGLTTITAIAGGGGGSVSGVVGVGASGGSGGGGGNGAAPTTGGSGTANQGYAGGDSAGGVGNGGGGGGGAGAIGGTYSGSNGGAGGAGVSIATIASATSTGVSNYYAGGGGAGGANTPTGGSGGGGNGATGTGNGTAGTVNTGGGGGGSGTATTSVSGAGGSGLVIVRYPV